VTSVVVLEESPCPRGSSRTNFQVLVLVLVLESQVLDNNTASDQSLAKIDQQRSIAAIAVALSQGRTGGSKHDQRRAKRFKNEAVLIPVDCSS